jgi:hypothetical protein
LTTSALIRAGRSLNTMTRPASRKKRSLDTLGGVLSELAKVYRAVRAGHLDAAEGLRRAHILREMRAGMEAELLADIEARLSAIERAKR